MPYFIGNIPFEILQGGGRFPVFQRSICFKSKQTINNFYTSFDRSIFLFFLLQNIRSKLFCQIFFSPTISNDRPLCTASAGSFDIFQGVAYNLSATIQQPAFQQIACQSCHIGTSYIMSSDSVYMCMNDDKSQDNMDIHIFSADRPLFIC